MQLNTVAPTHIDFAWNDGANCLAEACDVSGGEITADQLKMVLSRGERTLLQIRDGEKTTGWAVIRIDQLPNMRVLFVTNLVAHNGGFDRCMDEIRKMAKGVGCSRIRCAAKPAQARLYGMKCGFKPVYSVLELEV
jgi:hypothetical protein